MTTNKDYPGHLDLISTTEPSSKITYANDAFCQVAGYEQSELEGELHNIVRHADMPKAAFRQMWQYIQNGKSWMGLVKNLCKDGQQHYWVSAFVTPICDSRGQVIEYQSVRSKPTPEQIDAAEKIYANIEKHSARLKYRFALAQLLPVFFILQAILSVGLLALGTQYAVIPLIMLLCALLGAGASVYFYRRINSLKSLARKAYDNPLMEKPYTGHYDDFSAIELAMMMTKAELRAVSARARETTQHIRQNADAEFVNTQQVGDAINEQSRATEQVATATEQLTSSILEVAHNAETSSALAIDANQVSEHGLQSIERTIAEIRTLAEALLSSQTIIETLSEDSQKINTILDVITGISEQTNLLALNASIEAARAGQAGRGFAVVADEVRKLASKTAESAKDIHSMIAGLQNTAQQAQQAMQQGNDLSAQCIERANETGGIIHDIVGKLDAVSVSSRDITTAVTEQVSATQVINQQLSSISASTEQTAQSSADSVERTRQLVTTLDQLQRLIQQFAH